MIKSIKRVFVLLLFGVFIAGGVFAQGSAASEMVKVEAQKMATALNTGDYKTFIHYNNPTVRKQAGGDDAMLKEMQEMTARLKTAGTSLEKITIGNPSPVMRSGSELQCVVPQETVIKTAGGKFLMKSMLIAVSDDGGKNWTFVDASNRGTEALRKLVPNLNPNIVIPPASQPQRLSN